PPQAPGPRRGEGDSRTALRGAVVPAGHALGGQRRCHRAPGRRAASATVRRGAALMPVRSPAGYRLLLVALLAALVFSCLLSLGFGAAQVPLAKVLGIVLQQLGLADGGDWSRGQAQIVWQIRAPRVVLGALVGAGLALVGGALQAVTRNPLADPHLLGVSSGAVLGA